jgi:serine/threonine protein kinase
MSLQLLVIAGPDKGRAFPLGSDQTLLIGRGRSSGTHLADPHVSKVHCAVDCEGERATVRDEASTAGTFVNGVRVTEQLLRPGDVIRIGQTQLRLEDAGVDAADAASMQTLAGALPVAAPAAAGGLLALPGKMLSHYAVGAVLARGQSGVVFHARDTRQDRAVALKVLDPEFSRNDAEVQRLVRAMKTLLPLRHPNLVAVYGAGKAGPHCWIAMEYVEGQSAARTLERGGPGGGPPDWRKGLRVAVHVGRALGYAHENSILHRSVTPDSVLIRSADGVAKLGGLLLAKSLEGMLAQKITRPGEVVGELEYMSPERTRGTTDVDARSDLYSLGALAYALLTGRPPIKGKAPGQTLLLIQQAEPAPPSTYQPQVPAAFEAAVLKLLAKRREDRYQTAAELVAELEQIAAAHGVAV